ncbi:MAG: Ig-like domain repeat protein [Rudaea sp.]|uniref:Ig-like domain repeat protein n=1 Tax=Rudaea sp. TaxID=2136325 RepID=UPI0039E2BC0E
MTTPNRTVRAALCCVLFLAMAAPVFAATITVDSTDDGVAPNDGKVTLREAITAVNAGSDLGDPNIIAQSPGTFGDSDTIAFNIAGSGVHTIQPASALPSIAKDVAIDGFTQPGATANTIASGPQNNTSHTLVGGSNAVLLIELDGSLAGAGADGLAFENSSSIDVTLSGLVINRFGGSGIRLTGYILADIDGDYIGTDASGTSALGNGVGIQVSHDGYVYPRIGGGGPASLTLVSGNTGAGVHAQGASTNGSSPDVGCDYAYIGADASGTHALGNGGNGIELRGGARASVGICVVVANGGNGIDVDDSASADLTGLLWVGVGVGGSALGNTGHGLRYAGSAQGDPGHWDAIQHNGGAGVRVEDNALVDVDVLGSIIADNVGLAIDIAAAGPTPNDPGDADGGANLGQNSPVIASATSNATDGTTFSGSIDTTPNTLIDIYFAFDSQCDASRLGQSRFPAPLDHAYVEVTTDASGHADWTWHNALALDVSTYAYVSGVALAPIPAGGFQHPVSEFSPCVQIVGGPAPPDKVATTTTLSASPTSATFGHSVQFVATVGAASVLNAVPAKERAAAESGKPGAAIAAAPGGSVTFFEGATALGSASLNGTTATLATSSLAVGTHTVIARYSGDADYAASASDPVSVVVSAVVVPANGIAVAAPMLAPIGLLALAAALGWFGMRRHRSGSRRTGT